MDTKASLSLALLGGFEVTLEGHPVSFESIKVRALLAYLAVEAGRSHARTFLAEVLWPDLPAATALTYLRHVLGKLKQELPDAVPGRPPFLLVTRETVALNPQGAYTLDVTAFTALLEACATHSHRHGDTCIVCARRRANAVALYRGDFLAHFLLGDSVAFEEWAALKRERLRQQVLDALARLATYHVRRGTYQDALRFAWRQVELDPWRDEAYQQLMRALWLGGQRGAALEQYARFERILQQELGVRPSAETTALYQRIRDAGTSTLPDTAQSQPPHNLPAQTTPLVGREAELARLGGLLQQPAYRLITLTGPGGIGKTRLALQVAAELRDDFDDGVCFVALAPITDPALVIPAVAQALGVQETSGQPLLASLKLHLRARQLLLVLDNFEQVSAAAPWVAALLTAAPQLAVLVTSRVVLRLYGEHQFLVPPLTLPDVQHVPTVPDLRHYDAVRLFVARAQAVQPDFSVTDATAPAIAAICQRLDGLPLAIELAAARIRLLSPQAMLKRLDTPLKLLTGGPQDLPARQQTLRATIDWSYHLLPAGEQLLFARLAVFVGGWTLEAAEAICGAAGTLPIDPLDGMEALVAKSLVDRQPAGGRGAGDAPRFRMLEMIREYAYEHLVASGEVATLQRRHAEHYLALAETAERARQRGSQQVSWLEWLESEHDNLRAVLHWALDQREAVLALRIGTALETFWDSHGHLTEGRQWLEAALDAGAHDPTVAPALHAKALLATAAIADHQGDFGRGEALYEEALVLFQELGDTPGIAAALPGLARIAYEHGDYRRAGALYEQQLALEREQGNRRGIASALGQLGYMARDQGDVERGFALLEESLAVRRELGDTSSVALALFALGVAAYHEGNFPRAAGWLAESLTLARELGEVARIADVLTHLGSVVGYQGDVEQAERLLQEGLVLYQQLGTRSSIAITRRYQGKVAYDQGDWARATALYQESLAVQHELGRQWEIAACLEGLAEVAGGQGRPRRAAQLWGAAEAIRVRIGAPLPPAERARHATAVAHAHSVLGDHAFAAAWVKGQAMTLEQAVAYALDSTA